MIIKAFIPCARFERDPETGLMNIIGLTNGVVCPDFPCQALWNFFIRLTDHSGPISLMCRIVNLADGQEIARAQMTKSSHVSDPVADYDFLATLDVVFPSPGKYEIQVIGHEATAQTVVNVSAHQPDACIQETD